MGSTRNLQQQLLDAKSGINDERSHPCFYTDALWVHACNSFCTCCADNETVDYKDAIDGEHRTEAQRLCGISSYFFFIPPIVSTAIGLAATPFTLFADAACGIKRAIHTRRENGNPQPKPSDEIMSGNTLKSESNKVRP